MAWLVWLVLVIGVVATVAIGLRAYGATRWAESMQALTRQLEAARMEHKQQPLSTVRFDAREFDGLPAPVQRYFRVALSDGQPLVAAARLELSGTFNMSATGERWKPFTSRERILTRRPGFVWDAKVFMLPGLPVHVVDSYIAGDGLLHAALLGLFPVANLRGGGEIARGELMRLFAELAWCPTALLPSQGVSWSAIDDTSAHATLRDGPISLTLRFRFNEAGLIESAHAQARGAMVGKAMAMLPWEGCWSNYQTRNGMTVPHTCEVAWLRPEGRKPYFRGTVTALHYEFMP